VGGPYRGYPSFAVQPEIIGALDAAGIAHTGTYRTEADSLRPTIVDAGGVRVGLVAATYGLNRGPAEHGWSVDVAGVPDVSGMLTAAARVRAAACGSKPSSALPSGCS